MIGKAPLLAALGMGLSSALSCSGGDVPDASSGASVAESAETQVIPDEAVRLSGTPDQISGIADLAPGEDGAVWVLNTIEPFFVAVAEDGTILRQWGRKGDGPGEFDSPSTLLRGGEPGHVWAYDPFPRRLTRLDGPEDEIEEIFLPLSTVPYGRVVTLHDYIDSRAWIAGYGGGFLFAHSQFSSGLTMATWEFEVAHLAIDRTMNPVFSSGDLVGDPPASLGNIGRQQFPPYPLWATCPDGGMALYDPLTNSVRWLSASGEVTGSQPLPPERRVEVTMDRLWALIWPRLKEQNERSVRRSAGSRFPIAPLDSAAQYESAKRSFPEVRDAYADVFPEYRHLSCGGPDGSLWLQLFDAHGGGRMSGEGPKWLRIGRDGSYRRIDLPRSFRPLRFTDDRIWGSHRGEFDVESVAWIEMP